LDFPEGKRNSCLVERIACGGKGILADFLMAKVLMLNFLLEIYFLNLLLDLD